MLEKEEDASDETESEDEEPPGLGKRTPSKKDGAMGNGQRQWQWNNQPNGGNKKQRAWHHGQQTTATARTTGTATESKATINQTMEWRQWSIAGAGAGVDAADHGDPWTKFSDQLERPWAVTIAVASSDAVAVDHVAPCRAIFCWGSFWHLLPPKVTIPATGMPLLVDC
jgi:hypothetical protein